MSFKKTTTQTQLEAAFALVRPKTHWKDGINAVIDADQREIVAQAIIHFTGTVGKFTPVKSLNKPSLRVIAEGYRAGPCGDF